MLLPVIEKDLSIHELEITSPNLFKSGVYFRRKAFLLEPEKYNLMTYYFEDQERKALVYVLVHDQAFLENKTTQFKDFVQKNMAWFFTYGNRNYAFFDKTA